MKKHARKAALGVLAVALIGLIGCRAGVRTVPPLDPPARAVPEAIAPVVAPVPPAVSKRMTRLGYSVQVGAFSVEANAQKLAASLVSLGLDAFYFPAGSGLYKVRFGDFTSKAAADREARRLVAEERFADYFIIAPGEHAILAPGRPSRSLREKIVAAAEGFVGSDYAWGGTTSRGGFDCSGLVRAVYQLNGLSLPRSVADQYRAGTAVPKDRLEKGDLVFFSASPGGERSHVGIYVGRDAFIHAPGKGKKVRQESLQKGYFKENFCGGRAYVEELSSQNRARTK